MELTAIILNWNAADDTIRCVEQLVAWEHLSPKIIVVDNASNDGSPEMIAQLYPQVQLIRNTENLGFAGGTNQGIRVALKQGQAPILLLNNDAFLEEASACRLLKTLQEHPRAGIVGPLLFSLKTPGQLIGAGGKNPVLHHQTRVLKVPKNRVVFPVDYVIGAVALIRAEVFTTIGLLDEDYFFSAEMADLCHRARNAGYESITDTRVRAYHELERSSKFRETLYVYYCIRNRFIYARKRYKALRPLLTGFWSLYSLALALKSTLTQHSRTARAIALGMEDGLKKRCGGQNERALAYVER